MNDMMYPKQLAKLKQLRERFSLELLYPEIAREWDYERNELYPSDYKANSGEKVHWICPKGHRYTQAINRRTWRYDGCSICSGNRAEAGINDLGTVKTELMEEWDFDKNLDVYPTEVTAMSNRKVWWKCRECGHCWKATICNRTRGSGCPKCRYKRSTQTRAGKAIRYKASLGECFPELLKEWDYEKNTNIADPMRVTPGSAIKVWWKCKECGHEWMATINNRRRGSGCLICSHHRNKKTSS